eukprot:gene16952-21432_t
MDGFGIRRIPVDDEQSVMSAQAFLRFGKGRHPAKLNLGDCFSYALAKSLNAPLLYKGEDFGLTDIAAAVASQDLFPGFEARWIDGPVGKIFARVGGKGPPVVLIHGFPQTHAEWYEMAGELAKTHTVVCPDLRGYGWSAAPHGDGGKALYTKRGMGEDIVAAMSALGFNRFAVIGHDRGARVAYRLALDHPGRVERLVLLDILPT